MISGTGYVMWKINKDIEKINGINTPEISISIINTSSEEGIDTSDWSMYKNEEYGFELEFPGKIHKIEKTKDGSLTKFYYKESPFNEFPVFIDNIEIDKKPSGTPLDLLLNHWKEESLEDQLCPGCFKIYWQESTIISNRSAKIALVSTHSVPNHFMVIIQLNAEEVLIIDIFAKETGTDDLKEPKIEEKRILDRIISRIRFFD